MAVSICMVPLADDVVVSAAEVANHLAAAWPQLSAIEDPTDSENTAAFTVGLASVLFGRMPTGIPWSELEGPCSTAMLWPEADQDLRDHAAHVIVTVSADVDEVALSTLLTQVTSSFLSVCAQALGVYWGNATKLIRKDIFVDFATEILPGGPPMHIWIDCRVGLDDERKTLGFTTGMKSLGHMELEAKRVPEPPQELMARMISLGSYLVENGHVINDGDTIGEDADEKIRVTFAESVFGHQQRVMRLLYEDASTF